VEAASTNFYEGNDSKPPAAAAPSAGDDDRALALQLRFQLPPSVYATMAVSRGA
jgi:tRNA(Glu) U13 pseudouridine synthase TruD